LNKVQQLYVEHDRKSYDIIELVDGRTLERYSHPQYLGADIIGRVWSFRDVTERKQAEEELRAREERFQMLFSRASDGIMIMSPSGTLIAVNESFAQMHGYTTQEMLTLSLTDLDPPETSRLAPERLQRILSGEIMTFEVEHYHKDGHVFPLEVSASLIVEDNEPIIQAFHRDITKIRDEHQELEDSHKQLRRLASRLSAMREEESAMLAREIHDELGQSLTGIKLEVSWLARSLQPDQQELKEKSESVLKMIDEMIASVRYIASRLRPRMLDDLGLVAAVESMVHDVMERTSIKCEMVSNMGVARLDPDQSITVFRIAQEALTNVMRHSGATRIDVGLHEESGVILLEIRDNGRGIRGDERVSDRSIGLLGMQERALAIGGELVIEGVPGKGTAVILKLPTLV